MRSKNEPLGSRTFASALGRATKVLCGVLLIASVAMQDRAAAAESFRPFKLKTLDGVEKTLPNVLGKATLVVFFYPTCPFCNVAAPEIHRLYDTYKAQGLSVVYINTYPNEEKLVADWPDDHH